MIELHGGRLEITSTPGVGTKATVWLPPERILFPDRHASVPTPPTEAELPRRHRLARLKRRGTPG